MSQRTKRIVTFLICIAAPLLVGSLSALIAGDIRGMYESMSQPPLSPPGWLFGIVWPVLYILMGVALYRLFRADGGFRKTVPVALFVFQLALNFAWSIVFFGGGMLWYAFAVILALDIVVLACIVMFMGYDKISAWLLVPYMIWICFATYLNLAFALLN